MAKKQPVTANQPHREELYNMAISAVREGNPQGAKVLFTQILQQDPRNARAMMWLAKIARSKSERRRWLNRVLDINPQNEAAQKLLDRMDYNDSSRRNRLLFRLVTGAYVVIVLIVALLLLFAFAF
ncbi:tetratricopeptide repeat protein [Phototrophicus methaneseepsis]|uniref:Tetratricopeptide repeat protein n=1 Tax=Phototrophicus methaneseepsis TaxID=2710758 RepID=A0A7S8EC39_9CHLR|nr:tetratricopeptide repeat protein [Phototrophicus methaneseepsis]QPC84231.1 tetratricopeptide repeat protein [Phototrophicus methaneseepsis]